MKEILIEIKQAHLEDIEWCKEIGFVLAGLCQLSMQKLNLQDNALFVIYLKLNVEDWNGGGFAWDRDVDNKSRLNWLNEHIEIN